MMKFFRRHPKAPAQVCARRNCGHTPGAHALMGKGTCTGDGEGCKCIAYWFAGDLDPLLSPAE